MWTSLGMGALFSIAQLVGREGSKAVNSGTKTLITENWGKMEK